MHLTFKVVRPRNAHVCKLSHTGLHETRSTLPMLRPFNRKTWPGWSFVRHLGWKRTCRAFSDLGMLNVVYTTRSTLQIPLIQGGSNHRTEVWDLMVRISLRTLRGGFHSFRTVPTLSICKASWKDRRILLLTSERSISTRTMPAGCLLTKYELLYCPWLGGLYLF
ncbi:hypothetical protein K443DRAFT_675620 [Laccaria amethystina LaAM-08-1]|uniref:Uncharacterized protein n=1 Tax=Laccaria amethystina LaAM-08-1 TaxID=1095629 RepID=A0A0C9XII6_9AGAR|nr:hypothetical protein K443DRAFT_675620 [Laccaria amethystina LaAM-08-1]